MCCGYIIMSLFSSGIIRCFAATMRFFYKIPRLLEHASITVTWCDQALRHDSDVVLSSSDSDVCACACACERRGREPEPAPVVG